MIKLCIKCCGPKLKLISCRTTSVQINSIRRYTVKNENSKCENTYDAIVCGGGLIGTAMTACLSVNKQMSNKKILMLDQLPEPKTFNEPPNNYSNRVIAVSPGSVNLLKEIGAWDLIQRKCAVKKMQVWESCSDSMITFEKNNMNETLCYIIENNLIINAVIKRLKKNENGNTELKFNTKIKEYIFPKEYERNSNDPLSLAAVEMVDGTLFKSKLIIGADGANSFVAKSAKFDNFSIDYEQRAIVATLEFEENENNIVAWQRFLTTGPIALLPLNNKQSSLIWTATDLEADRLMNVSNDEFVEEVNNAFCQITKDHPYKEYSQPINNLIFPNGLGTFQLPPTIKCINGKRSSFPLGLCHNNHYIKPRVALIGDSAHRVHPLAGQGANLGFGDVISLNKCIETALYQGKDIGILDNLLKYENQRQAHNVPIICAIHGLNALYSTEFSPFVALRSLGLSLVNQTKYAKEVIMEQAMS